MSRNAFPVLALLLLTGCMAAQAPSPVGVPSTASAVVEPAETDPYRAPDFAQPPAPTQAGAWVAQLRLPTPTATPTPVPTPVRFPYDLLAILPQAPDGVAAPVGGTMRLTYEPETYPDQRVPAGLPWQLLDPQAAAIANGTTVQVTRPGPIYAYVEHGGVRHHVLLAGLTPGVGRLLLTMPMSHSPRGAWAAILRTRADWEAFWAPTNAEQRPSTPPIDFGTEDVVAVHSEGGDQDVTPVVTGVQPDGTVDLVFTALPDTRPRPGMVLTSLRLFGVPKAAQARQLRGFKAYGPDPAPIPVAGPTGPAPSPEPTPVPPPSGPPGVGFPACERGAAPPYGPPDLSRGPGPCYAPTSSLSIGFLTRPVSEPWLPALPVGATAQLHISGDAGAAAWEGAPGGTFTATRRGAAFVKATAGQDSATALLAVTDPVPPALRFWYRCDWSAPADATPRGPRVYRADDEAWRALWRTGFLNAPPGPPVVDFARYDVVALVDDRLNQGDQQPVLTHVSGDRGVVHLVHPGASGGGLGYSKAIHLFLTGKLAPRVAVAVTTRCGEARTEGL